MTVKEARNIAKDNLSEERFFHTECVAKEARKLADRYREDPERAEIAGYLHDIAKEFPKERLLQMIERSDIIDVDEIEHCFPVWHAYGGGIYAKETLGLDDEIADAISHHTAGCAGMTLLEKIVFLADYISDDRDFKDMDEIRKLAYESLDEAIMDVLSRQVGHLMKYRKYVDINTIRTYNDLLLKTKKTGEN